MAKHFGKKVDLGQPRSPSPEADASTVTYPKHLSAPSSPPPDPFSPESPQHGSSYAANRSPVYMTFDGDIVGDPGGGQSARTISTLPVIPPCPPKPGVPAPPPPRERAPPTLVPRAVMSAHRPLPPFVPLGRPVFRPTITVPALTAPPLIQPAWIAGVPLPTRGRLAPLPRPPPPASIRTTPVPRPAPPAAVVKPSPTGRQVEGTQCPRIPLVPPFKVVSSSAVVNSGRASISSIFSSDTEKEGKGCVPYHSGGLMLGTREQPPDTRRSRSRSPLYSRSRSRTPQRDSRPVRRRSRSRSSSESSQSRSRRRQYRRSRSDSRDRTTRRGTRYSSPRRSRYSSSRSSSRGRRSSSRGRRYSRSLSRTKRYSRSPSRDRRRPPRRDRSPSSDDRRSSQRSSRRNRSSSRSSLRYRSRSRSVSRGRYRSRSRDVSPKSSSSNSKRRRSKSPRKTSEKRSKRKDKEEGRSSPKKKSQKSKESKKDKKDKEGVSGGDVTLAQKAKPTDTASWCSIITEPISCDSGSVQREENGVGNEQRGTVTTISKLPAETALKMEELFLPWVQGLIETDTTVHEDERREAAAELEDFGSIHDVLMDLEGEELKETLEELQLWWPVDDVQMTVE